MSKHLRHSRRHQPGRRIRSTPKSRSARLGTGTTAAPRASETGLTLPKLLIILAVLAGLGWGLVTAVSWIRTAQAVSRVDVAITKLAQDEKYNQRSELTAGYVETANEIARDLAPLLARTPDFFRDRAEALRLAPGDSRRRRVDALVSIIEALPATADLRALLRVPREGSVLSEAALQRVVRSATSDWLLEQSCSDDPGTREFAANLLQARLPYKALGDGGGVATRLSTRLGLGEKRQVWAEIGDAAGQEIAKRFSGNYRLRLAAVFRDDRIADVPYDAETTEACVAVEHHSALWFISLFGNAWTGRTEEFWKMRLEATIPSNSFTSAGEFVDGRTVVLTLRLPEGEPAVEIASPRRYSPPRRLSPFTEEDKRLLSSVSARATTQVMQELQREKAEAVVRQNARFGEPVGQVIGAQVVLTQPAVPGFVKFECRLVRADETVAAAPVPVHPGAPPPTGPASPPPAAAPPVGLPTERPHRTIAVPQSAPCSLCQGSGIAGRRPGPAKGGWQFLKCAACNGTGKIVTGYAYRDAPVQEPPQRLTAARTAGRPPTAAARPATPDPAPQPTSAEVEKRRAELTAENDQHLPLWTVGTEIMVFQRGVGMRGVLAETTPSGITLTRAGERVEIAVADLDAASRFRLDPAYRAQAIEHAAQHPAGRK